jgi:hypothetical protein
VGGVRGTRLSCGVVDEGDAAAQPVLFPEEMDCNVWGPSSIEVVRKIEDAVRKT